MPDKTKETQKAEPGHNVDPVCGMEVFKESTACSFEYKGKTYYFCAASCRDAFTQDPQGRLRTD
jgi:YHS domain-containing protein